MIECDRQTFDRVWSGSGGPTVVPIAYENDQFSLCVEEASVDAIAGILHLDESERLSLRGRTEIESEWYLDDDGEQLTPDTLCGSLGTLPTRAKSCFVSHLISLPPRQSTIHPAGTVARRFGGCVIKTMAHNTKCTGTRMSSRAQNLSQLVRVR